MTRVYNFSAGPAMLAEDVLKQASEEMLQWRDEGMSVMEMSHRGKAFMSIAAEAEADLRKLMDIPDNYKVMFLQGGASSQFAMIPLNLLAGKKTADFDKWPRHGKMPREKAVEQLETWRDRNKD